MNPKKAEKPINLEKLAYLYMDDKISFDTLYKIIRPLEGLPLPQRDHIASKILKIANDATSEEELISRVKLESEEWLKEFYDGTKI